MRTYRKFYASDDGRTIDYHQTETTPNGPYAISVAHTKAQIRTAWATLAGAQDPSSVEWHLVDNLGHTLVTYSLFQLVNDAGFTQVNWNFRRKN